MNDIKIEDIWSATDNGRIVIEHIYPASRIGFERRQNFRIRPESEDKEPSCTVFKPSKGEIWLMQDKGGGGAKARNAIQIVQEEYNLSFPEALTWIVENIAPQLLSSNHKITPRGPKISKSPESVDEIQLCRRTSGKFTEFELKVLGYKIKQEHCDKTGIIPLDYYITKKNEKGESWIIESTDNYPIYYWDRGDFGRLYQPFGDLRFMYVGKKPEKYIFADKKTAKMIEDAKKGIYPSKGGKDKDGYETQEDERIPELIICSGGSDALNVFAAGYPVVWPNSESEPLTKQNIYLLKRISQKLYVCYDQDVTGIKQMHEIALQDLDTYVIYLPDDLGTFKTSKGGKCKDIKDLFVYYRPDGFKDPRYLFKNMVKTAQNLKFWSEKYDKDNNLKGYDINNEHLYGFLQANGIYCTDIPNGKRKTSYIKISGNVVTTIAEDDFQKYVNDFLVSWIKNTPEYYDINILNAIHRSNQVKLASLDRLKVVPLDLKTFTPDYDFLFFRNRAVRISADGYEIGSLEKSGKHIFVDKIIQHDFRSKPALFSVQYSNEYNTLSAKLGKLQENTPEWNELHKELVKLSDARKYKLTINDPQDPTLQFVYNTGRTHWKKEQTGHKLSEQEQSEHDLNFISKVAAMGYFLTRHKEKARAYMLYGMETEMGALGEHNGGTGKSLFFSLASRIRSIYQREGQTKATDDMEKLFDGIKPCYHEGMYIDDLKDSVDLHRFLSKITGNFEYRSLYSDTAVIPFEKSPKMAITSNHSIMKFDNSLRRRIWFVAFSDYYHPEAKPSGQQERSPYTEFGKNIPDDYTEDEMNNFYNFMINCMSTYMRFRQRINPPMEAIERRTIQQKITEEFIWWCDEYFTPDRINVSVDRQEAYDAFQQTIPAKYRDSLKMNTFKERVRLYCSYISSEKTEYIFNPPDVFRTETERKRGDIREYKDGKDVYCFHIRRIDHSDNGNTPETLESTVERNSEPSLPF